MGAITSSLKFRGTDAAVEQQRRLRQDRNRRKARKRSEPEMPQWTSASKKKENQDEVPVKVRKWRAIGSEEHRILTKKAEEEAQAVAKAAKAAKMERG